MTAVDLVAHVAAFARALRERGVRAGLSDEADAVGALTLSDVSDRDEVRVALKVALKIRRRDVETFEALFASLWGSQDPAVGHRRRASADERRLHVKNFGGLPGAVMETVERHAHEGGADTPGYSPEAMLRKKPFEECTERDLAEMQRLLARMALALATRKSRRLSQL